jgi:hypothetical protein
MLTSHRAAQQIRFAKMPIRSRAGSSPMRNSDDRIGPEVMITEPSRPANNGRLRRESLGAVEAVKQRARRDTATSSDMSSENELDPSVFQRRQLKPSRSNPNNTPLLDHDEDDEFWEQERLEDVKEDEGEVSDHVSEGSSLSSEYAGTVDSASLLDPDEHITSSPLADLIPPGLNITSPSSPRKPKGQQASTLQALPPPRPISTVIPISALGLAIRARQAKPTNPVENFARFSGKGALEPLNIKIYTPFSEESDEPFEMPLQKSVQDSVSGAAAMVTVADAIGLCLWRYCEEGLKPVISREDLDVNRWTLRIVDDGEVEYDFPALNRISNIVDFTSNNNRPARARSRGKVFDEFALVKATDAQYSENKKLTPKYTRQFEEFNEAKVEPSEATDESVDNSLVIDDDLMNTSVPKPFAFASRKGSATLDQPAIPTVHSTPRTGPPKLLKIHFTSLEAHAQTSTIEVTTDTYIAEVLELLCKRWSLDKAHHFLKISGTNTTAPLDRTVEAIGARTDLDLVRRRFAHDGTLGLASSPSSSSPNAPLWVPPEASAKKGKKGPITANSTHPLAQKQDAWGNSAAYKKYTVIRKQPMSFAPSHSRTLLMDGEYLHICPSETGKTLFDTTNAKTTTVPFSYIIGCKTSRRHPKAIQVKVLRDRDKETKRYDFEAQTVAEAGEIVAEIKKGMDPFRAAEGA